MTQDNSALPVEGGAISTAKASSLRRWNIALGSVHAVQAVAVIALATAFTLPVTASFLAGPPGTPAGTPTTLFDVSVAWGVALFLLLSAGFHWLVSSPGIFGRYISGLGAQHNYYRWAEYSLSSSIMIVLIAMLTGISDIAALIGIFAANAAMILFGAVQERYEKPGGSLLPFWMGSLIGIMPWLAVGHLPGFTGKRRRAAGIRLCDLHLALPLLQRLRHQHVVQYRRDRTLAFYIPSASRPTSSSAWLPSRLWRGRSSRARWPAENGRRAVARCNTGAQLMAERSNTTGRRPAYPPRGGRPSRGALHDHLPPGPAGACCRLTRWAALGASTPPISRAQLDDGADARPPIDNHERWAPITKTWARRRRLRGRAPPAAHG